MKNLFVLLFSSLILLGCYTVEGIGMDVKRAGEVVENAARK